MQKDRPVEVLKLELGLVGRNQKHSGAKNSTYSWQKDPLEEVLGLMLELVGQNQKLLRANRSVC